MVPVTLVPQHHSPHHSPQHRSPQHRSPQRHSSPSQPTDGQDRARRTDAIVSDLRATRPDTPQRQALVDELVQTNAGVARSMASRYRNRGIDLDDLQQVALLGLTKAAQRFDPEAGHDFLSFAVPTVRGELRRHFRDSGWMIRPPRRVQDLQGRIARAQNELESQLGRSPRPTEIAAHLGEELDGIVEALSADGCFTPASLDNTVADGSSTLGDLLADDDRSIESIEAKIVLAPVVRGLSSRDQQILRLRFYEERTQQEIAEAVGLTQAQVSRVLTRILTGLRAQLAEPPPAA